MNAESLPFRAVVVDDSDSFRTLLIDYLEGEEAFDVVGSAEDGEKAESVIDLTDPDVVILDVHLPDVSGLEVLQHLRERHKRALFVISSCDDELEAEAAELGADVYIDKTTPFDELCDLIIHGRAREPGGGAASA